MIDLHKFIFPVFGCWRISRRQLMQVAFKSTKMATPVDVPNSDVKDKSSIKTDRHAETNEGDVCEVPMEVILRPIPPVLDEDKVRSLMVTIQDPTQKHSVPPIDVMWITGRNGGDYYYSFGGCHRYEAHKRLGLPEIKGRLIKSSIRDLWCYLGASTPDLQ